MILCPSRCLIVLLLVTNGAIAQVFDERFTDWPLHMTIKGRLVATESWSNFDDFEAMLGRQEQSPAAVLLVQDASQPDLPPGLAEFAERAEVCDLSTVEQLEQGPNCLVWFDRRQATEIPAAEVERLQAHFQSWLERGNTLGVIGPHCEIVARHFVASTDTPQPLVAPGMNLLLDCVLESDFQPEAGFVGAGDQGRLLAVLATHPRCVGIGLAPQTVLVLDGRKFQVRGEGTATFLLTANDRIPIRKQQISPRNSRRQRPAEWLVDLGEWRRDAIDRTLEPFPPASPEPPHVEHGTLMIVGGGGMPEGLMEQFVELAGGAADARLVYIPCAEEDEVAASQSMLKTWQRMDVVHTAMVHTKDRTQANEDEQFLQPLREATGIWFGGGRQWNFADSYYGTTAHRLMKEVLQRGGVIGGSSAGASIQARYLARATPIENYQIMAPGYERGGLGFISGVAIDQHFSQRGRQADMSQLVNRYPQLLGIGLDEATAIIVRGSVAEVVGRGKAHFYDRRQPVYPDRADYVALQAGDFYDLQARALQE